MSTNFYLQTTPCPHCGRNERKKHIGKKSQGWSFLFSTDLGKSKDEVMAAIEKALSDPEDPHRVIDEYGRVRDFKELVLMVEESAKEPRNHGKVYKKVDPNCYLDPFEFTFINIEFN